MRRSDVVYGSIVGNTTNPQFLEVDSWVIYLHYQFMIYLCYCILMMRLYHVCHLLETLRNANALVDKLVKDRISIVLFEG